MTPDLESNATAPAGGQPLGEAVRDIIATLKDAGIDDNEAKATGRLIVEDFLGIDQVKLITSSERVLLPETVANLRAITSRVATGEPVQYVLGKARFMGRTFVVNPSVLIPRPETAMLVDMAIEFADDRSELRVLDLCTGSGCIAVSLAAALKFPDVTAIDISEKALEVAEQNAALNKVKVRFLKDDVLAMTSEFTDEYNLPVNKFDIITCNPPYIAEWEKDSVDKNVLDHEPHYALFVEGSDPALFFKRVAELAGDCLAPGGRLFFEIDPGRREIIQKAIEYFGLRDVEILRDFNGIYRFAIGTKNI